LILPNLLHLLSKWDKEVNLQQQQHQQYGQEEISNDALIVADHSKQIFTHIFDRRTNIYNEEKIISEKHFNEFVYIKGDSKRNNPPFRLEARVTILSPSYYWKSGNKGIGQLKIAKMDIFRKVPIDRKPRQTPEEQQQMRDELLDYQAKYGGGVVDKPQENDQQQQGYYVDADGNYVDQDGNPMSLQDANAAIADFDKTFNQAVGSGGGADPFQNHPATLPNDQPEEGSYDQVNQLRQGKKLKFTHEST